MEELAKRLAALSVPRAIVSGVTQRVVAETLASLPPQLKDFIASAIVENSDLTEVLRSHVAKFYVENFSEEELEELVAQMESPVAKKFTKLNPEFSKALYHGSREFTSKLDEDTVQKILRGTIKHMAEECDAGPSSDDPEVFE